MRTPKESKKPIPGNTWQS